jgi:hypothetical protein
MPTWSTVPANLVAGEGARLQSVWRQRDDLVCLMGLDLVVLGMAVEEGFRPANHLIAATGVLQFRNTTQGVIPTELAVFDRLAGTVR